MSILKRIFPPITAAKSFAVTVGVTEAHDTVLKALTAGGYTKISDDGTDLTAQHGDVNLFVYGTVSEDVSIALLASPSSAYPISVDVAFHEIEGGCQVSVNASYIRPVTFMGAPRKGPMSTKWHEACYTAVATVVSSLEDVLV